MKIELTGIKNVYMSSLSVTTNVIVVELTPPIDFINIYYLFPSEIRGCKANS